MSIVQEIRQKIDIVTVIGSHVSLKKHGREYIGICPFHGEKTPSFFVNPQKGVFFCFGCQAKGNIFDFYTKYYNVGFNDALKYFANQAGIELKPITTNDLQKYDYIKKLHMLCELAKNYFSNQLFLDQNRVILDYLLERNLNINIIKHFDLGYCPVNNDKLFEILKANDANEEDLLEIGLKNFSSKGSIYESFKDRIIFPIKDIQGRVIAFGGRAVNDSVPKYLNSKESKIFSKKIYYMVYTWQLNI